PMARRCSAPISRPACSTIGRRWRRWAMPPVIRTICGCATTAAAWPSWRPTMPECWQIPAARPDRPPQPCRKPMAETSDPLPPKRELALALGEKARRRRRNRLALYRPYPRQAEFHAAGAQHRERLFLAGNQLGKTLAGAFEYAMHLTGRYPDWWQ